MKRSARRLALTLTTLVFAALPLRAAEVVPSAAAGQTITLENIAQDGAWLRGTLVNRTGRYVHDIKVSVTYYSRWRNGYNPGPVSPGWAATLVLPDSMTPGEVRVFEYKSRQVEPARADGVFLSPRRP